MATPAMTAMGVEVVSSNTTTTSSSCSNEWKDSALKLNGVEEGNHQVEEKEGGDVNDDDDNGYHDYPFYSDSDEEVIKQFRLYEKQIDDTEGFDVDFNVVLKLLFLGGVHPIRLNLFDDLLNKSLKEAVLSSIEFYNQKKNANLEFMEILKANLRPCAGHLFHITFNIRESGEMTTFQTNVFNGWNDEGFCIEVEFSRPKPEINPR